MRLMLALPFLALLAACDSTTPAVGKWNHAKIETGGMRFGVHWSVEAAEAYRTSKHLRPRLSEVMANARVAIEQASGCTVKDGSMGGDAAIVTAALDCPSGQATSD
jgi:hypothetical protein